MKRKKLNMAQYGMLAPNVQRGGQAIPMGNNLYLMKGRQHSAGGIDIGKDLEVENNEVMQMLPNETRVFSSMPMLGGYSPAQLVAAGNNPDLVFNAQERWKKENRVHDDGSTYKEGGIHINPANKGKFTAQAKQHGMGVQSFANKVLDHKENYSPTTVKRATFAKYIGGRKPFGGSTVGTPLSSLPLLMMKYGYKNNKNNNLNMNDEVKVMKMLKNVTPKNNYEEAVDGYPSLWFTIKNILNHENAPKSGLSNCTLTVSQLYNPSRPINHARTITKNPRDNGFYEVGPLHVIPGSMAIASNNLDDDDESNRYHTMIVNGFADKDYVYNFDGKSYDVKAGTPLVSYSRGGNSSSDWRTNIPIDVYLANGEGKNFVRYYRPLDKNGNPNVLLDELVVSPNKKYGGKTRNMNLQNIYNNSLARLGKRINGSIVRMDGSGIDKLAYIPFTGNRLKTLKAGGRRIAEKGIRYPVRTRNNSTIDDVYIPVRTRKNSTIDDADILEERMKYVEPYFEGQSDIPGYIAAGINGLGSVVSSLIANNAIDKQRPPVEPMPLIAPKLKTNFNINADLDANREATGLAIHNIKKNTASSQVGRNLINQQLFAKALADSKLYTDKEKNETELINADIAQRAGIINKNIEMGNTYRQALADFYSNRALAKGQNWAQMANGLSQTIGMGLNNIGATNTKKLNALIAMLPAIETFMKNKQS